MTLAFWIWLSLCTLTVASVMGVWWAKNVLHASLWMIACLLAVAGLYALQGAEFLAVVQIMIYAGGILVLILFGIMLTARVTGQMPQVGNTNQLIGVGTGLLLFSFFAYALRAHHFEGSTSSAIGIPSLGQALLTSHAAPFELSGVLLLVSLVAAALAATYQPKQH